MSNWMSSGPHQELAEYFYDVVSQQDENVPEPVASHIRRCPSCRGRIARLREMVFGRQTQTNRRQSSMDQSVIDTLDSHFRYLDEEVTCSQVRPFLPGLLDPSVELRIPTPITVHLDHCPQCASDLESLRGLALDGEQRHRLRGLYEREARGAWWLCRRARSSIEAFVRGAPEGIGGDVLDHLSACRRCRAEVYSRRQAILNGLQGSSDGCGKGIATVDLFDYAVPRAGMGRRAVQPDALHVGTCRKCLETVQAIHRAVYGVVERPESGVATVYRTVEADRVLATRPDNRYAGYGVTVEVVRRESGQARVCGRTVLQKTTANPHVRRILKAAVAAAALIPLAALYHYTHTGSGVTLGKVLHAFRRAENIHVTTYNPVADAVFFELRIARGLNLQEVITPEARVVYDFARKKMWDIDSGEAVPVSERELANARRMADDCLGFTMVDLRSDIAWDRVDDDGDREVYELTWEKQTGKGRGVPAKCEVAIDKSTMRPENVRFFKCESATTGWECSSVTVVEYLTDAEMNALMSGR